MAQVTLYLDDETATNMKQAARRAGVSQSRWLAELVRQRTASEWPTAVKALCGAWPEFPTTKELSSMKGGDVGRERF